VAGLDFRVEMPTLPPFVARFNGAQAVVRDELTKAMQRIVIGGQNASRELAGVDTGSFRNSIVGKVTSATGSVTGQWGSNRSYAPEQEYGRRAGAPMPPQGSLLGWMGRHGLDASLEFVIRRAIARNGIKARHVFSLALDRVKPIVAKELSDGLGRALARIGGGQ
jgi:hypothetical protein